MGDQVVEVLQQHLGGDRHLARLGQHRAVAQVRPGGAGRFEVDVLLPHRRAVRDVGLGVGRDGGLGAAAQGQVHPHAADLAAVRAGVVEQVQLPHLADRDAAVGDLGIGEDAAGVREVGAHRAAARPEQGGAQPDVAEADVADAEQREHHEQQQLDLGRSADHGRSPPSSAAAGGRAGVRVVPGRHLRQGEQVVQQMGEVEVGGQEQVGVVAPDAVDRGPRERVGRQQLQRLGQRRRPPGSAGSSPGPGSPAPRRSCPARRRSPGPRPC